MIRIHFCQSFSQLQKARRARARRAANVAQDQALGTWIRTTSLRTPSRPPKAVSLSIFSVTVSAHVRLRPFGRRRISLRDTGVKTTRPRSAGPTGVSEEIPEGCFEQPSGQMGLIRQFMSMAGSHTRPSGAGEPLRIRPAGTDPRCQLCGARTTSWYMFECMGARSLRAVSVLSSTSFVCNTPLPWDLSEGESHGRQHQPAGRAARSARVASTRGSSGRRIRNCASSTLRRSAARVSTRRRLSPFSSWMVN